MPAQGSTKEESPGIDASAQLFEQLDQLLSRLKRAEPGPGPRRGSRHRRPRSAATEALEAFDSAVALYDRERRLVACNRRYRMFHGRPIAPGTRLEAVEPISASVGHRSAGGGPSGDSPCTAFEYERGDGTRVEGRDFALAGDALVCLRRVVTGREGTAEPPSPGGALESKSADLMRQVVELKVEREALIKDQERLRDFAEIASDWLWEMDADLRFTYMSDRVEAVTGVPAAFHIGKTRKELAAEPVDDEKWRRHLRDLEERKPFRDFEFLRRGHDGRLQYLSSSGTPIFGADGTFQGYRGTGHDITARRRAEDALRETAGRLDSIMAHVPLSMSLRDPDSRCIMFSRHLSSVFGKGEELLGRTPHEIFAAEVAEAHVAHDREVIETRQPSEREYEIEVDGEVRTYLTTKFPIFDPDLAITSLGSIGIDITERKRAEQENVELNEELARRLEELRATQAQLLRRERLATLGQLTASVSHELRNPLGSMRASIAAVRKLARNQDPVFQSAVDIIDRSITRCDNIISELLDFTGLRDLVRETVRVDDWLGEVLDEHRVPPEITVVRDLGAGIALAFDRDRLRRVLVNLLDNACQAMVDGLEEAAGRKTRRLTVASRVSGPWMELSVSDTGRGVAPEHLDQIFEPLFSTKSFGVGLGLAIVRQIMDQHGGGVELDSRTGQGTRVTLRLPLVPAAPGAEGPGA